MTHNYKTAKKGLVIGAIVSIILVFLSPMIYDALINYFNYCNGGYGSSFWNRFASITEVIILCTAPSSIGAIYYLTFRDKYI